MTSPPSTPKLNHENLDVYQAAISFAVLAVEIMERFPRGHAAMADQLRRAAFSIPLNIAEGYGKRSQADRARSYDIARGSAHACGAIWDVARLLGVLGDDQYERGKTLLHRAVSMLVRLVEHPGRTE
ncbi:MAG: four helix bundle protein [Deltaproteobacteria bacterium]|nr:four helix bundle protein [Deltaproteobacteria bacterium]